MTITRNSPISANVSAESKETIARLEAKAVAAMRNVSLKRRGRRNFTGAILDWLIVNGAPDLEQRLDEGDASVKESLK